VVPEVLDIVNFTVKFSKGLKKMTLAAGHDIQL
jgi:hypothetical protein